MHAYVDETIIQSAGAPTTYILCAALVTKPLVETQRAIVHSFTPRGQSKLHWHDARNLGSRRQLLGLVASLEVDFVVVKANGDGESRQERLRRKALLTLLSRLEEYEVVDITIESRGPLDRLDRNLFDALRAQKTLPRDMRIDHKAGPAEPLLALADIVCGLERNVAGFPEWDALIKRKHVG